MGHYEVAVNSSHLFPYDFIGKSNKLYSLKNDPSSKVDYRSRSKQPVEQSDIAFDASLA